MKYCRLIVFIRHDNAEGFRYGPALVVGTPKIMASTVFLMRVVRALKQSIENFSSAPSTVLTKIKLKDKATATKRWAMREIFTRGCNAQNKQNAIREQW
jgi:hypothetical protein